jgi:tetratricopeptide (TPR) repeat protein
MVKRLSIYSRIKNKLFAAISSIKRKNTENRLSEDIRLLSADKNELEKRRSRLEGHRYKLERREYKILNTISKRLKRLEDEKGGVFDFVITKEDLEKVSYLIETAKSIPKEKLEQIAKNLMNEFEIDNLQKNIEQIRKAVSDLTGDTLEEGDRLEDTITKMNKNGKDIPQKEVLERIRLIMDLAMLFPSEPLKLPQMKEDIKVDNILELVLRKVRETQEGLKPANVDSLYRMGIALLKDKEYQKAKECFDEITTIDPNLKGAWLNKGFAAGELGDISKEIGYYKMALKIDKNYKKARNNMKIAKRKRKRSTQGRPT